MNSTKTKRLIESAAMIALATVLSIVKIVDMPSGGSVTLASMLPIVIIAFRYGTVWGLGTSLVYSVVQLLLGLDNLGYVPVQNWQSVLALIVFDYILAFLVIGLAGLFRKVCKRQSVALACGAGLAVFLRFVCHFISGCTVWAGLPIPDSAAAIYSLSYNATYMLPEAVILIAVAFYIGEAIDFRSTEVTRMKRDEKFADVAGIYGLSWFSLLIGFITDVVLIAPNLQNDDGEFSFVNIGEVEWLAVAVVTVISVALCVGLILVAKNRMNKKAENTNANE